MLVHTTERFVGTLEIWCRSTSVNGTNQEMQKHGLRESAQNQITAIRSNKVRNINFTYHERIKCFGFMERKLKVVTIFVFTYMYVCVCRYVCTSMYV